MEYYYWIIAILRFIFFVGMFAIAMFVLLPKAVTFYSVWKKTGKMTYLSGAVAVLVIAFFFVAADFVMFIQAFMGSPCGK